MPLINGFSGGGGGGSGPRLDKAYYNFPLSIGPEFPVPIVDGHIYVQMPEEQAAQITKVYIDSAVRVSHEDNSLILVCQNRDTYLSIQEVRKVDGREVIVSDLINADAQGNGWQAGYNAETNNIRKTMPMVYAKLGGVVEMQTAWVYHGEKWVQLSVKGQYLFLSVDQGAVTASSLSVYNFNGNRTFVKNDAFPPINYGVVYSQIAPNGRFIFYHSAQSPYLFGYRRTGDSWEALPTVNQNAKTPHQDAMSYRYRTIAFSPSGHHMAVAVNGEIEIYKYDPQSDSYAFLTSLAQPSNVSSLDYTPDGSALYVGRTDSRLYWYEISGDNYTQGEGLFLASTVASSYAKVTQVAFSSDGEHVAISYMTTSTSRVNTTASTLATNGGVIWAQLRTNKRKPTHCDVVSWYPRSSGSYNPISINSCAITPDGRHLIFYAYIVAYDTSFLSDGYGLFEVKLDGDNIVKSTSLGTHFGRELTNVSLSQDGKRLWLQTAGGRLFYEVSEDASENLTLTLIPDSDYSIAAAALPYVYHAQFVPYGQISQ